LVMYANLEAKVLPRTKLANGTTIDQTVSNIRVGSLNGEDRETLNFLKPRGKNYFDTSWSDQITGKGSTESQGANQSVTETVGQGITQRKIKKIINNEDTQLLGITKIDFSITRAAVPTVKIEMVDVQGRALFEQGENSPYSAFMQFPYPPFLLTLKGYYGKAVQYELMVTSFNTSFDSSSGNYNVSVTLQSYRFPLQSDILLDYLYSVPKISPTQIERRVGVDDPSSQTGLGITESTTSKSTLGYEKLNEVYSVYKSKGLIDENFPHLTVTEMKFKMDNFEKYVMAAYGQEDLSVLSDIERYTNDLKDYKNNLFPQRSMNWFDKYIDKSESYVLNNLSSQIYYKLKKELETEGAIKALGELRQIIEEYNAKLNTNTVLGSNGSYKIGNKKLKSDIDVNIKYSDFVDQFQDLTLVDFEKTYQLRTGTAGNSNEILELRAVIEADFAIDNISLDSQTQRIENDILITTFITFGETTNGSQVRNSYLDKINTIEKKYNETKVRIEEDITLALSEKIQKSDVGLGFIPTVNNIAAVLCASADAFLRILDDVHEFAWNKRKDPIRLRSIISSEKSFGVDNKTDVQLGDGSSQVVYPWPQYFDKEYQDGQEQYILKYPGLPSEISKTQGFRYDLWPEIKFVEDYIRASIAREEQTIDYEFNNTQKVTKSVSFNTLSFPFENEPYTDLSEVSFFYEIYDRSFLPSFYSKLAEQNDTSNELYSIIGDFEVVNIQEKVNGSSSLTQKLKRFSFNSQNFLDYLRSISNNGTGLKWNQTRRDLFSTNYLDAQLENPNGIFNINTISSDSLSVQGNSENIEKLNKFLKNNTSNKLSYLSTYPFTNLERCRIYLENGQELSSIEDSNDTTNIYEFFPQKKTLSTFSLELGNTQKRPVTNFEWMINTMTSPNQSSDLNASPDLEISNYQQLKNFFNQRDLSKFLLFEGNINYGNNYDNNAVEKQTTSIFNTPYLINSILEGNENEKNGKINPYTSLGYLVLNGLPFSTLHEKIKSQDQNGNSQEGYLFSSINKFSAIHKLPYLWILKYGSIWYRYKKNIVDGIDILEDIWNDVDYINLYDPTTQNINKNYNIKTISGEEFIYYLQKNNQDTQNNLTNITKNIGFYPKMINEMYYLFTKKNVITSYPNNIKDILDDIGVKIDNLDNSSKFIDNTQNLLNDNQSISLENWFQYININGNLDFDNNENKVLLIPSCGFMNFNQSILELSDDLGNLNRPLVGNQSLYNGSFRGLWGSPNYGYFDTSLLKKPRTDQYIKNENSSFGFSSNQDDYNSIEDIFATFNSKQLDEFERHFLNFCERNNSIKDLVEKPNTNSINFFGQEQTSYKNGLFKILQKIFVIENVGSNLTGEELANELAKNQIKSNLTFTKDILEYDIIYKNGNPGNFDRRIFNSFSDDPSIRPVDPVTYEKYITGSLPTSQNNTSLNQSVSNYPEAWRSLYLNVGVYTNDKLGYSSDGSYITDFFRDFNIEFNKLNVERLSQIIKIYASRKVENENLTTSEFKEELDNFLKEQKKFQNETLNYVFLNLNRKLPEIQIENQEQKLSKVDGNIGKNEQYYTFKAFNDKWIAGRDFKNRTLFEDILILDTANRPAGDILANIDKFRGFLGKANSTTSLFTLLDLLFTQNGFISFPIPTYYNFYGRNYRLKESNPIPLDTANDTFGTHLNVDYRDTRPKMLFIHRTDVSQTVDQRNNANYVFGDDSFDLRKSSLNPLIDSQEGVTDYSNKNKVVGFTVNFGNQNQSIFKNISIDMSNQKTTSLSIQVQTDLADQRGGQEVAQQSQSLINYYKTLAFECNVECLGNVMIQPTMYFYLSNVPMFHGTYMIEEVSHSITPNNFITNFTGVRAPIYRSQPPDKLVASVNRDMIRKYRDQIRSIDNSNQTEESSPVTSGITEVTSGMTAANSSACIDLTKYPDKPLIDSLQSNNQDLTIDSIFNDITNMVNETTGSNDINLVNYLIVQVYLSTNNLENYYNNNLFGIRTDLQWGGNLSNYFDEQHCGRINEKNIPYASFSTHEQSIRFMVDRYKIYFSIFDEWLRPTIINENIRIATALTDIFYSTWYDISISENNANPQQILNSIDLKLENDELGKSIYEMTLNEYKKLYNTIV
jgi:hypothetical protein